MKPDPVAAVKPLLGRPSNNLKIGIVGMPNVGKSSLFNLLTNSSVSAENYPFCTIDPSESRCSVSDPRFDWLVENYRPASRKPAYLTVVDIAGLVRGASEGAGLGNAFLANIKAVDAIFHLVRGFDSEEVVHVEGEVDPIRDLQVISEELRLKDVEHLTKALESVDRSMRNCEADKGKQLERDTLRKMLHLLQVEKRDVRHGNWSANEIDVINGLTPLTAKAAVFLVNVSEDDYVRRKNRWLPRIKAWVDEHSPGDSMIPLSVGWEQKLLASQLTDAQKPQGSALPKVIVAGYATLRLMYFFTAGEDEVRAWTVRRGCKAPQAAGVIHTDFERGFIAAEVMHYDDLHQLGTEPAVKVAGKYLLKGKEYVVEDGDVIFFKFNVTSAPKKK